ncbi:MAG: TIR domain-containing protein [Pirellulaceae bacterium]|nr:TIR domain-containing protein [Pirellulaceae bacterium]
MSGGTASNYFVYSLLRARDWQHRPQFDDVCQWWRGGGRGVLALVGMGGAGKTAIAERFLRVLPGGLPPDPDVPKDGSLPTPHGVFVFSFYDAPNPEAFFEALQMWLEHSPRIENVLSLGQIFYLLQQTSGLLVLDGLEKVQEDGVRGLLGRLASPKLREFLDRIAAGYFPELSVLVTSRFPLADLRDARPQFFRLLPIEEIELPAGIRLLRARGVRGTDPQLAPIVDACGRHALTVDFAGGYIAEFGGGDPATPVDFEMDSARLQEMLDDEPDEARRHVLKQGHRFARLAERYRDAMLGGTAERSDGDAAALALLQRICLFRLGVDANTLANIFTGEQAVQVSGPALAGLSGPQLQKKLDWLVRMRIVESQSQIQNQKSKIRYTIHPAVRDGFLSGLAADALREYHEAVRQGLAVSLGDAPGENPSDPATLDLLEEIVHHTLQSGRVPEAWDIYRNRIGGHKNLLWRLGAYERGERICRAFAGGVAPETLFAPAPLSPRAGRGAGGEGRSPSNATTFRVLPYQSLPEATQAIFINEWALYLKNLGRLAAAARCYQLGNEPDYRNENWSGASIGNRNLSGAWLLSGRLTAGQATAAEALRLAELPGDATHRCYSRAFRAHAHALRGEIPAALADFRVALDWQHKAEGDDAPPLYSNRGIWHTHLLARLGRRDEATRLTEANIALLREAAGEGNFHEPPCRLILSDLHREAGDLAEAETLLASAHEWAVARDAKEVLCWSALVQARIALAAAVGPEGAKQISPGQSDAATAAERRPGNAEHLTHQALKGRNKTPPAGLSRPFRAEDSAGAPVSQGDALGWSVAGPSGRNAAAAATALADGLKIARDCGFGCYHIDLLLARARLHLVSGEPHAALDDLRTALDEGVPGDEQTGQPELLAATHPECGYAWAIAEGLQLRAEALLLQAAQTLGQSTFVPAHRSALPAAVGDLLTQAESCLTESLVRWQPLHDPEPERPDQNFQLDGKQYNYRAAETHRLLTDLVDGVLTNYPLRPLSEPTPETPKPESEPTMTFHVFLSHNSKDKPAVRDLKQKLLGYSLTVWFDEDELQPGIPWQQLLEDGITKSGSIAVLVGKDGLGPWEDEEMQAALGLAVADKRPVIPVLMPGASAQPKLPMFLGNRTWVDLRGGFTKDGLDKLVWGITGKKPNP